MLNILRVQKYKNSHRFNVLNYSFFSKSDRTEITTLFQYYATDFQVFVIFLIYSL